MTESCTFTCEGLELGLLFRTLTSASHSYLDDHPVLKHQLLQTVRACAEQLHAEVRAYHETEDGRMTYWGV